MRPTLPQRVRGVAHRPRFVLVGLVVAGCYLTAVGPASAAGGVTASFARGGVNQWSFSATAGTGGGPPTGTVQWRTGGAAQNASYTGSVTCLVVRGYTAVIGTAGIEQEGGGATLFPRPPHSQSYLLVVVDNSSPTKPPEPSFPPVGLAPGDPPDQFGLTDKTNDCSKAGAVNTTPMNFSDRGDVVVRDARDRPPRLSLPRVRVTVRTRQRVRVKYRVTAKDDFDRHPSLRCSPRSGSRFRIGATRVRCTARDRSGLTKTATFFVHIKFRAR